MAISVASRHKTLIRQECSICNDKWNYGYRGSQLMLETSIITKSYKDRSGIKPSNTMSLITNWTDDDVLMWCGHPQTRIETHSKYCETTKVLMIHTRIYTHIVYIIYSYVRLPLVSFIIFFSFPSVIKILSISLFCVKYLNTHNLAKKTSST